MRKFIPFIAAGVVAASGLASLVLVGGTASAKAVKPPVTATCTSGGSGAGSLFGTESNQLVVGCTGSTGAKVTATGSIVPNTSTSSATIYWTNKDTTTESFSYTAGGTCPTFLGVTASTAVTVAATITGGNAKLTVGQKETSVDCLYSAGGDLFVRSAGPVTF